MRGEMNEMSLCSVVRTGNVFITGGTGTVRFMPGEEECLHHRRKGTARYMPGEEEECLHYTPDGDGGTGTVRYMAGEEESLHHTPNGTVRYTSGEEGWYVGHAALGPCSVTLRSRAQVSIQAAGQAFIIAGRTRSDLYYRSDSFINGPARDAAIGFSIFRRRDTNYRGSRQDTVIRAGREAIHHCSSANRASAQARVASTYGGLPTGVRVIASIRRSYGGTDPSLHQAFLRGYGL
ncbi:hypothetical protein Bbelb_224370 [Branchiostoma belcheri]|nr:hypothetical protein Bbelb_224370 [Branchiostoma belcheri]